MDYYNIIFNFFYKYDKIVLRLGSYYEKMSSLFEKELRKSVGGKFREKDFEYNEILVKIRKY